LFLDGNSPATIQQDFSAPILERSMERSKFYLANQGEVDENIRQGEAEIRRVVRLLSEMDPEAYAGLMRLRE
jgi:hypothetical protein